MAIRARGHVPNSTPLCSGCPVKSQLDEVVEAIVQELVEAQADMQMPMGVLRLEGLTHVGPTHYPVDDGLDKTLARLRRLLTSLGHPMAHSRERDDLGELPKVLGWCDAGN